MKKNALVVGSLFEELSFAASLIEETLLWWKMFKAQKNKHMQTKKVAQGVVNLMINYWIEVIKLQGII